MATLYAYSPNGTQATLPVKVMGFTQSLATNGWCKLPNGLIFQWFAKTADSQEWDEDTYRMTFKYPITFSSIFTLVVMTNTQTYPYSISSSRFLIYAANGSKMYMMAVGK